VIQALKFGRPRQKAASQVEPAYQPQRCYKQMEAAILWKCLRWDRTKTEVLLTLELVRKRSSANYETLRIGRGKPSEVCQRLRLVDPATHKRKE